jgi:hypothetical protein
MNKKVYFVLSIAEMKEFIKQEKAYRKAIGSKSKHPTIVFNGELVGKHSDDGAEQVSNIERQ